jgi:hypothetical protein
MVKPLAARTERVEVHYRDIGECGPRLGCGFFVTRRLVREVAAIESHRGGAEMGTITYDGKPLRVFRSLPHGTWTSDRGELEPIKAMYW